MKLSLQRVEVLRALNMAGRAMTAADIATATNLRIDEVATHLDGLDMSGLIYAQTAQGIRRHTINPHGAQALNDAGGLPTPVAAPQKPAVVSAASAAPPPVSQAKSATEPARKNGRHIRHDLLRALHKTPGMGTVLLAKLLQAERKKVSDCIVHLRRDGLIRQPDTVPAQWILTNAGCEAAMGTVPKTGRPLKAKGKLAVPAKASAKRTNQAPPKPNVATALTHLEQRLTHRIEHLDVKRETLTRLSQLLDPSIGRLLMEIHTDLTRAAGAHA